MARVEQQPAEVSYVSRSIRHLAQMCCVFGEEVSLCFPPAERWAKCGKATRSASLSANNNKAVLSRYTGRSRDSFEIAIRVKPSVFKDKLGVAQRSFKLADKWSKTRYCLIGRLRGGQRLCGA